MGTKPVVWTNTRRRSKPNALQLWTPSIYWRHITQTSWSPRRPWTIQIQLRRRMAAILRRIMLPISIRERITNQESTPTTTSSVLRRIYSIYSLLCRGESTVTLCHWNTSKSKQYSFFYFSSQGRKLVWRMQLPVGPVKNRIVTGMNFVQPRLVMSRGVWPVSSIHGLLDIGDVHSIKGIEGINPGFLPSRSECHLVVLCIF